MSKSRLKDTCLVAVSTKAGGRSGKKNEHSCSGILVNQKHGYVLTQGTALLCALSKNSDLADKLLDSGKLNGAHFHRLSVTVVLEHQPSWTLASEGLGTGENGKYSTAFLNVTSGSFPACGKTEKWAGEISLVWKVEKFEKHLMSLFSKSDGWKFVDESAETEKRSVENKTAEEFDSDRVCALLPYFVLIKLHNWRPRNWQTGLVPGEKLRVGQQVFAVGTPFGNLSPAVFLNSLSRGIVCNAAGENNALILTDARCIPGSEGGAIYCGESYPDRAKLVAVIVAPLCWKANEWIGFSICCSLSSVLESLKNVGRHLDYRIRGTDAGSCSGMVEGYAAQAHRIWFIRNGGSFGTGILISETRGLILTCSHVVKATGSVMARDDTMEWYGAEVLYATPNSKVFDLALLKLEQWRPRHGKMKSDLVEIAHDFQEGDAAWMIGHAAFDRNHCMAPTVTRGIVARVVNAGAQPILLQSTCAVHGGASGGPLVAEDGKLISIVTCNARDTKSGASYPHINMSVPLKTVWPAIKEYADSQDVKILEQLQLQNTDVEDLWRLQLKGVGCQFRSQL